MKVLNVAGFDLRFEREGRVINIPYDNVLHSIPDDYFFAGECFDGMLRIVIPPTSVTQIVKKMETNNRTVDINDQTIKEIIIEQINEKNNKPLKGKRIKPKIRAELKKTRPTGKKKVTSEE